MASGYRCDHCGKGRQVGHNVSHSKRRTRKIWRPNLQVLHYREALGVPRKTVRLCVKCLRHAKEHMKTLAQKETIRQLADKIQAPQVAT